MVSFSLLQRYYNPDWGRFISADDIVGKTGELLSHNRFAYTENNPVMYVNPDGNYPKLFSRLFGRWLGKGYAKYGFNGRKAWSVRNIYCCNKIYPILGALTGNFVSLV